MDSLFLPGWRGRNLSDHGRYTTKKWETLLRLGGWPINVRGRRSVLYLAGDGVNLVDRSYTARLPVTNDRILSSCRHPLRYDAPRTLTFSRDDSTRLGMLKAAQKAKPDLINWLRPTLKVNRTPEFEHRVVELTEIRDSCSRSTKSTFSSIPTYGA